jgi:hypothetical protein
MSRALIRQSSDNLRRSYLRDAVGTPSRAMFDDSAPASSMLYRGQYDPSLEINYVDDPRLAVGETFTRATIGTTVDFEGRVLTVKSGEARFYGMRRVENRLRFTEDFTNALWTKTGASVVARAPASGAPLKDRISDKLVEDTSTGNHQINQSVAYVLGATYCVYVDVAPGERTWCELLFPSAAFGSARGSYFDLANAVVGSAVNGITARGIFPVGDGFLRCWILHTASASASGTPTLRIATADLTDNYTGDGRSGVYLRRSQDQDVSGQSWQGSSEYVSVDVMVAPYHGPGVDGVRYFVTNYQGVKIPRYTNTATAPGRCGLLRERASTNLCLQSADFSNASWAKVAATIGGSITLPDGTTGTVNKLQEDNTTAQHFVLQGVTKAASALAYTFSAYLKQAERTWAQLSIDDGTFANGISVWINLATGALGTLNKGTYTTIFPSASAAVTAAANGFWRVALTATSTTSTTVRMTINPATADTVTSYLGTTGSGIYVWGAQLEQLDHATSYIPTTTASVTRNKDRVLGPTLPLSAWYGTGAGTWYGEVVPSYLVGTGSRVVGVNGAQTPLSFDATAHGQVFDGTTAINTANIATLGALTKIASRYGASGKSVCLNGGAVVSDASAAYIGTTFEIGEGNNSNELDGCIGRIWHIPRDIGDRIKDLTT